MTYITERCVLRRVLGICVALWLYLVVISIPILNDNDITCFNRLF